MVAVLPPLAQVARDIVCRFVVLSAMLTLREPGSQLRDKREAEGQFGRYRN
jgi:hypothetical protein